MADRKFWSIISGSTVVASLCCLTPLVLVIFGLSSVAFAASLADLWYGTYKWAFRGAGFLLLSISLLIYFRSRGICTLAQAKRRRNEIINRTLLAIIVAIIAYIIFLYVIVHYAGVWLHIWE